MVDRESVDSPFQNNNSAQNILRQLKELLGPYEKLKKALDATSYGLLVFEGNRVSHANQAAAEQLRIDPVDSVGIPVQELNLSGALGRAVQQGIDSCLHNGVPYRETILLGEQGLTVKADPASQDLTVVTISHSSDSFLDIGSQSQNEGELSAGDGQVLLSSLLHLAEVISREVPPGGEASYLCHQILRMVSQQKFISDKRGGDNDESNETGLFEACRDLVSLIRYSLPRGVEVFADIPAGESVLKHRSADLRRLIVLTAIDSAKEINLGGQMKISAREAEDSVVFEVETRPGPQGFSPVDDVGLQDCRTLCKSMGGHLVYWTETERRVRLINLPTAPARAEKSPESGFRPSGQEGKGKTILLVDDEESIRSIGRSALSKFGYSVLTAKDGVEGVEKFRKHQSEIDLVVLDLVMPNMGGAGCFEKIKEMDPGVRVVLMSGFTRNRRVNDLMSRGCLFFLRKPFDLKELHSAVRDAILHSRA